MAWPKIKYSKNRVNQAGITLCTSRVIDEIIKAIELLDNWRACHGYPINTFQATLRNKLDRITDAYLVAQRLKRFPSIIAKLNRFPKMKLSRMQDIGGLRAVVGTVQDAEELRKSYLNSRFKHQLVTEKDYMQFPK